jgi:hypothetical protein
MSIGPLQSADKPAVLRLSSDPLAVMELEKIRISLTRQISHYGWRRIALGLQAACEHGAAHQRANPNAAALWRWRAQMMRQLAGDQVPSPTSFVSSTSEVRKSEVQSPVAAARGSKGVRRQPADGNQPPA